MKIINADDLLEHAEVNGESEEFINRLDDYIKDAPKMNWQAAEPLTEKQRATLMRMRDQFYVSHNDNRFEAVDAALKRSTNSFWKSTDPHTYTCDNCGYQVGLSIVKNYCPNCGAYMKGEE